MSPRVPFLLGFAMLAVAMVNADCPCDVGEDRCHCNPMVIKPPRPYRPNPCPKVFCARFNAPAYQGADLCGCKHRAVLPAPKQPPRCLSCLGISPSPCTCSKGPIATIPFSHDDFDIGYGHYEEEQAPATGVQCGQKKISAADPVSLHLAYNAAARGIQHVREGVLNYGFMAAPKYEPLDKGNQNIDEEALNVVNKKILELRVPSQKSTFVEEEFHPEDDIEYENKGTSSLSYAELGYMPEKGKSCSVTRPPRPCKLPEPVMYVGHAGCPHYHHRRPCDYPSSVNYAPEHSSREMQSGDFGGSYDSIKSSVGCGGPGICCGSCGGTCGGYRY